MGPIYTAAHLQRLIGDIATLREHSPSEWEDLPLYELVALTDQALIDAAQKRAAKRAQEHRKRGRHPVREYYLAIYGRGPSTGS